MARHERGRFESVKNWLIPATAVAGTLGLTALGFFGLKSGVDSLKGTDPIRIPNDAHLVKPRISSELSWVVRSQAEVDMSDCGGETIRYLPDALVNEGQNSKESERLPHGRFLVVCKLAELPKASTDAPTEYADPQIVRFDPAAEQAAG